MARRTATSRSLSSLALLWLTACAGSTAARARTTSGSVPVAALYSSRIDATWSPPPAHASFYTAVRAGASQADRELRPDRQLALTAQAVAERIAASPERRTPGVRVVQALAWASGAIDPVPALVVARVAGDAVSRELSDAVGDMAHDGAFNLVGIGRAPLGDGSQIVVAALAQRRVTLRSPVQRSLPPGGVIRFAGALAAGLRNPEIVLTRPDGRTEHVPLGEGPEFVGQIPTTERGAYQVELLAEGEGGSTVIANFPVYVGVEAPPTPDDVATTSSTDPRRVETELLALLNEARRSAGRPALATLPALTDVARAHSRDMAQHHFVAHTSRTTGAPVDRLRRAGLTSGTILENLGRGYAAREIHEGLMASPGHRANILNPRVTHVGIGAATEIGAGGGVAVTEDFIEVGAAVDTAHAPDALLERINEIRGRRGVRAVAARPQLMEVAARTARSFFDGSPSQQQVVDAANRQINRFGLIFRRVAVVAALVPRLEDAQSLEPLMEPGVTALGIGVAQGSRPDTPPNSLFVVFVLGYAR